MNKEERILRLKLSLVPGIGPVKFHKIMEEFGSIYNFVNYDFNKNSSILNKSLFKEWKTECDGIDINNFLEMLREKEIGFIVFGDKDYPLRLKNISSAPVVLYYKGNFHSMNFDKCISVVGTRASTDYGRAACRDFTKALVDTGFCIVSGMAFGIDKIAHQTALQNKGKTIAVLASSVDKPSPYSNRDIYYKIIKNNGLVMSEYPTGVVPDAGMFPLRNRIIAGLSLGTVVIEAGQRSGALITANLAFEMSREVFAVPGDFKKAKSAGTNNLIKSTKAKLINCPEDIFIELEHMIGLNRNRDKTIQTNIQLTGLEGNIVDALKTSPLSEDKIKEKFDISTNDLLASLSKLEIERIIKRREDGCYMIIL